LPTITGWEDEPPSRGLAASSRSQSATAWGGKNVSSSQQTTMSASTAYWCHARFSASDFLCSIRSSSNTATRWPPGTDALVSSRAAMVVRSEQPFGITTILSGTRVCASRPRTALRMQSSPL